MFPRAFEDASPTLDGHRLSGLSDFSQGRFRKGFALVGSGKPLPDVCPNMTQCFNKHPSDAQRLNHSITPVADCECNEEMLYRERRRVTEVPVLTCAGLWRVYQREAEDIVAPNGVLIADPVERNRVINAAYARLWLQDSRFQWAGLAALASKQVGCGLLHASDSIELIHQERDSRRRLRNSRSDSGLFTPSRMNEQARLMRDYKDASARNPVPALDLHSKGEELSMVQQQFRHVYEMMALGNTTLFLDIFPLHAFYAKRGLQELKCCLKTRAGIYGLPTFPVLWPVGQAQLKFGSFFDVLLRAFQAVEEGQIALSVKYFAEHEQRNILQPTIYEDPRLVALLRSNHASFVTGFPSGVAQSIELTLANQCESLDDGRTIGFGNNPIANLADIEQRMDFVLRAADRFDELLSGTSRFELEQSIRAIAAGAVTP
jgi:hypothetical protein